MPVALPVPQLLHSKLFLDIAKCPPGWGQNCPLFLVVGSKLMLDSGLREICHGSLHIIRFPEEYTMKHTIDIFEYYSKQKGFSFRNLKKYQSFGYSLRYVEELCKGK